MTRAVEQTSLQAPSTGASTASGPARDSGTPARDSGTVIGKYRIKRRLGQGGMGAVYLAEHIVIGRPVALKFLHPQVASNEVLVRRLRREAAAAGGLVSEHIAAVTDFDLAEDGTPYLVMELLEGESLADRLQRGSLTIDEALDLGIQVSRGLAMAHARRIAHRDLTPGNVFLCRHPGGRTVAKILDFGIALAIGQLSVITGDAHAGTAPYMAPEQARADPALDHRVDLYSLGTILYEALAGKRAHPGDTYGQVIYHLLDGTVLSLREHRPDVPDDVARVIHQALARDVGDRFASAEALEAALASCRGVAAPMPRPVASRRRLALAAGLAVLVTAAAVGLGARAPRAEAPVAQIPSPERSAPTVTPGAVVVQTEPAVPAPKVTPSSNGPRTRSGSRRRPIVAPPVVPELAPPPPPMTFERQNPYR